MTTSSSANALLSVNSPYSGELLAQLDTASMADVQAALATAAALHRDRHQHLTLQRRIEILHNTVRIMSEQAEELARLAASEGGKPMLDSRVEVTRAIDGVQLCIEALRHDGGQVIPMKLNVASTGRVVFDDADIPQAVTALTKGAFYHAGQVCVSVQRIFAHADIAPALAEQLAEAADNLVLGDPLDPGTEVGPLIRGAEIERVDNWVREAIELGAHALCGAEREGSYLYRPTVLSGDGQRSHGVSHRLDAVRRAPAIGPWSWRHRPHAA